MMMPPYKGYFIDSSAVLVHRFSPDWYVCDSILVPGPVYDQVLTFLNHGWKRHWNYRCGVYPEIIQ